jgi:hypothetical protein
MEECSNFEGRINMLLFFLSTVLGQVTESDAICHGKSADYDRACTRETRYYFSNDLDF